LEAAVVLVMLGLLSAIAVPRFLSSRARAHQAEVRNNLKEWYLVQRSFYEENARYEMDLRQLGFTVDRGNRYAYYFGFAGLTFCEIRDTEVAVPPRPNPFGMTCIAVDRYEHGKNTPALPAGMLLTQGFGITHTGEGFAPGNPGVTNGPEGWSPEGNISAVAVGVIAGNGPGTDSWYISSADARVSLKCGESKEHLEAGTPINTYDDVDHDTYAGCF
jgi:type IV pilus assembly protein PilA